MPSRTTPKPVVHPTLMTLHGSLVHPTDPATRPVRVPPHKPVRVRPQASCSRTAIPPMCLPDAWSLSSHRTPHTHTTSYSAHTTRSSPMPGLPLWSAVALQQHVLQTGSPLTASLPLARYPVAAAAAAQSSSLVSSSSSCSYSSPAAVITDDWTLAQKMGLIAPPPPPPTEEDWAITESRALQREHDDHTAVSSLCAICCESFHRTHDEGQVILPCSHVFHERCFTQLERFARQRRRHTLLTCTAAPLSCPLCRHTARHKRMYYASQAHRQCAAVVRIQALVRGFCARRRHVLRRLRADAHFRRDYVAARLQRLTEAWEGHRRRRDVEREALLRALEVQQAAVEAAYWGAEEWDAVVAACVERGRAAARARGGMIASIGPPMSGVRQPSVEGDVVVSVSNETTHVGVYGLTQPDGVHAKTKAVETKEKEEDIAYYECPICMEALERDLHLRHETSEVRRGKESASGLRDEATAHSMRNRRIGVPTSRPRRRRSSSDAAAGSGGVVARRPPRLPPVMGGGRTTHEACGTKITCGVMPVCGGDDTNDASRTEDEEAMLSRRRRATHAGRCGIGRECDDRSHWHSGECVGPATQTAKCMCAYSSANSGMKNEKERTAETCMGGKRVPPTSRFGVLLSCGHCFHQACITAFERYVAMDAEEHHLGTVCPSCPVCRRGYASHPF